VRAVDLIQKKRDGGTLTPAEIRFFIEGVTRGAIPDYQASALLMAIFFRGMAAEETAALTSAMIDSGARLDLSEIPGRKVDKHSTGGVGDKSSLILAPIVAACGAVVPMMSGRGLGHTGGTLDKLESIPGFRTNLSIAEMKASLASVGCAMIGQTAEIATGRQAAVRPARRQRNNREHSADFGVDHVQEDRRRHRRPGARRQGRPRCVHEVRRERASSGLFPCGDWKGFRR
jgi:thymidine phosphorylase